MLDPRVIDEVDANIENPSEALIPAGTSLYRAAHRFLYDRKTRTWRKTSRNACYESPWWSTYYDFNQAVWASSIDSQRVAARSAYAIHTGWGGDCRLYASIETTTDLSVWYGIGKAVVAADLKSGQMSYAFPSEDVLQIYIPGFRENALKWSVHRQVRPFGSGYSNGRGYQGALPAALQPRGGG